MRSVHPIANPTHRLVTLGPLLCSILLVGGACGRLAPEPAMPPEPKLIQPQETAHRTGDARSGPTSHTPTVDSVPHHWHET